MNYPAASCGVSSSVLARHSVLDTESSLALWIPASAGMTNSRQAAGNEPPVDSRSKCNSGDLGRCCTCSLNVGVTSLGVNGKLRRDQRGLER